MLRLGILGRLFGDSVLTKMRQKLSYMLWLYQEHEGNNHKTDPSGQRLELALFPVKILTLQIFFSAA